VVIQAAIKGKQKQKSVGEGGSYQVQTFAFVCRNDASLVCCLPYFAHIQKQMQTYWVTAKCATRPPICMFALVCRLLTMSNTEYF